MTDRTGLPEPASGRADLLRTVEQQESEILRLERELRQLRHQASQATSERTRFIAAASHDLLQPLSAARLYAATLAERTAGTAMETMARGIEASLGTVEEMMGELLDISRLDSGAIQPVPQTFQIAELQRRAAIEFAPLTRRLDIDLRTVPSSATVTTDRALLWRILQNLVSNALKYNHPGGRVLVGVRRQGSDLRLDVIDTGIGIAQGQQDMVFGEFTRLAPGSRMADGLGLGLSIVQRLVAKLGLGVEIASEPGRGSRFWIILPRAREEASAAQSEVRSAAISPIPTGTHVLCVDNEEDILSGLSGLLAAWGCDVRVAPSLKAVVDRSLLDLWLPDLILMDYHLDQVSGLDAIDWLHQTVGPHVPAVLLTADNSHTVRHLAEARGIPILRKPVKPAALRSLLASLTAAR